MARTVRGRPDAAHGVPRGSAGPPLKPLRLLHERPGLPAEPLPRQLAELYGGNLGFAEPRTLANLVQTIDGVVAIPDLERSNALIAGNSDADRFVMALLRAFADAIIIGSATLRSSPRGTWRPEVAFPAAADGLAELRRGRGRPDKPQLVVVTTGRSLDPGHPALAQGAIVLTTSRAANRLRAEVPSATEVVAVNEGGSVDVAAALSLLRGRGHSVILSEAGPHLFTSLVEGGLVDELFLTVSPLLAGRDAKRRPGLVEGAELLPGASPATLLSARLSDSHLFLRYGLTR